MWPIANYFYFTGLMNHGFKAQAGDLVERLTRFYLREMIEMFDGRSDLLDLRG